MALSTRALQNILRMILKSEHYRKAVIDQITDDFLEFAVSYFKDIARAKAGGKEIGADWYKKYFLDGQFSSKDTAIYAGLNDKTIRNIYGSSAKQVVIDITPSHFDELIKKIDSLVNADSSDMELDLAIKTSSESVGLSLNETLIAVNILGVKRSEIRGGAWSGLGKRLELPLMLTMAKLFQVPPEFYSRRGLSRQGREVDFHFFSRMGRDHRCEVKLMGKGNPESVDSSIARDSGIFIADTLSDLNKRQLDERNCYWVELRAEKGYQRMYAVLQDLGVPCVEFAGDLDAALDEIIPQVFEEIA